MGRGFFCYSKFTRHMGGFYFLTLPSMNAHSLWLGGAANKSIDVSKLV